MSDTVPRGQRALLRSAELNADFRRLGIAVAKADYYPTLSVFLQSGYQAYPPAGFGFPSSLGLQTAEACPSGSAAGRLCQNGGWFSDRPAGGTISMAVFDILIVQPIRPPTQAHARRADLQLRQTREAGSIHVARARAELRRAMAVS